MTVNAFGPPVHVTASAPQGGHRPGRVDASTTHRRVGRRFFPAGLLAATAVAGSAARASASSDDGSRATILGLSPDDRHVARRFSFGLNGLLRNQIVDAGGWWGWFNQQLAPSAIDDPVGDSVDAWFPSLQLTPQQLWARYRNSGSMTSTSTSLDLIRYTLMKRTRSTRQLLEVMTDFWSNLLHVASPDENPWPWRPDYDQVIRANAFTSFETLLKATVLHPAMLLYLDNYESTKTAPNENLGRELLECHTVGVTTPYTETDVLNSTRILTGWAVDRLGTCDASYEASGHYTGPVRVLGFTDDNASPDGRQTTYAYLSYLAHHPATARRIAEKLAVRFVADVPSASLVADVAQAYLDAGTDIKTTLRALVTHPDFMAAARDKVRTPAEDYVATVRALRIAPRAPVRDSDFANQSVFVAGNMGQRPFDWPTPDGFPDVGEAWASATRMLGSWSSHQGLAGGGGTNGGGPNVRAHFRDITSWLPDLPATFAEVVTAFSLKLSYEMPTAAVLQAACQSVNHKPNDVITRDSAFVKGNIPLLLSCLLDSPTHMKR